MRDVIPFVIPNFPPSKQTRMSFKEFYKDLFTFHKHERNGVVVLIVLLTCLGIMRWCMANGSITRKELTIAKKKENTEKESTSSIEQHISSLDSGRLSIEEKFDPNELSDQGWKELGLSEKQIGSLRKFQSKGGKFKSKEDIKKMYMISDKLYAKIENWMTFPAVENKPNFERDSSHTNYKNFASKPLPSGRLDLNTADTIALSTLPGIGPFLARKIVQWRDKLGGFISENQLYDVWKMTPEKVDAIKPYVSLDQNNIHRLNINLAEYDQLRKHPYLTSNQASAIVAYRRVHGNYLSIEDLKKVIPIDAETMTKIRPYVSVD
jgi:competence protein ComEA